MKCSMCSSELIESNLKFSCSHFLCNKCLSRKILTENFSSLLSTKSVKMNCSCGGDISVSYETCLKNIANSEKQQKKNKYCTKHHGISDTYCLDCRMWLCPQCISQFHSEYFKNHRLCSEDKMMASKCFYHRDYNKNFYCKTCNKLICEKCKTDNSNPSNIHKNHPILSLEEYKNKIKSKKKNLQFKDFDKFQRFVDGKEMEITKSFIDQTINTKKCINECIEKLKQLRENYISKYNQELSNLKYIFTIIKQAAFNFYQEMKEDKIDLGSFDFISNVKEELNDITYTNINYDYVTKIEDLLRKIDLSQFYTIKFNFRKLIYKNTQKIQLKEGVTSICALTNLSNSFICSLSSGTLALYTKSSKYKEISKTEDNFNNTINTICEIKKNEPECNFITGGNNSTIKIWRIDYNVGYNSQNQNNNSTNRIYCIQNIELRHDGNILNIYELNDGKRIASSSSKNIIIWSIDRSGNDIDDIIIKENVAYESCLLDNEINLISGSGEGRLKIWDISKEPKKPEKPEKPEKPLKRLIKFYKYHKEKITCMIKLEKNKIATGSADTTIILWDLNDENNIKILYGHKKCLSGLCYNEEKNRLFSCSKDFDIRVWDLNELVCTNVLKTKHTKLIYGMVLCSKSDIITCSNDCSIKVYSAGENDGDDGYDDFENAEENYDNFE